MAGKEYQTIKDDFFSKPLSPIGNVSLMGMRCRSCGEVFFGKVLACQNCQSEDLEATPLGRRGTLFTYTIIRNEPPGDYKGPKPFQPFALGLVELPEGVRILAPLEGIGFDELKIGMELELGINVLYTDASNRDVLAYHFRPAAKELNP